MSKLEITAVAGERGPVITLSGESDVSTAAMLKDALDAQVADGAQHLTVDLSGLEFADSSTIAVLLRTHQFLRGRGGGLVLAFPQPLVARSLSLLQVDQLLEVQLPPVGSEPDALLPRHLAPPMVVAALSQGRRAAVDARGRKAGREI